MLALICLLLSLLASGHACSCWRGHAQASVCWHGSVVALVEVKSQEIISKYPKPEKVVNLDNNSASQIFESAQVPYYLMDIQDADTVRYGVSLIHTFKGVSPDAPRESYLYTSIDEAACGIRLQLHQTYLIFGTGDRNGGLDLSLCDQWIHWNSRSNIERANIQRYVSKAVSACNAGCEIKTCESWMSKQDCAADSAMQCVWTDSMNDESRNDELFPNRLCMPTSKTTCSWDTIRPAVSNQSKKANVITIIPQKK